MVARCFAAASLLASFHLGRAFTLSEDLLTLSLRAAELSLDVYSNTTGVSGAIKFTDEPESALFVKEGNVCWAAFRGTMWNLEDWLVNFGLVPKATCSPSKQCCRTHSGFRDAYFLPSYSSDLENTVRNCKSTCPDCEVVLTGHSQGGAVAFIAAIDFDDLDPTIITFGQPTPLYGSCPPINVTKYHRYVNTKFKGGRDLFYDPIPFLIFPDKLGHMLLLGDDDQNVVLYNNGIPPSVHPTDFDPDAHMMKLYVSRLTSLLKNGSFPIGTDGWDVGFGCDEDSECISKKCVKHRCSLSRGGSFPGGVDRQCSPDMLDDQCQETSVTSE